MDFPALYGDGSINIPAGAIFRAKVNQYEGFFFACDESVYDDPIGTVKLWISTAPIPPGWQSWNICRAGFRLGILLGTPISVRFSARRWRRSHPSGSGIAGGSGLVAVSHLPPYRVVKFIERYA